MGWDVGNYTPGITGGTPFDFALLAAGFERLRMAEDNKDWKCDKCGTSGKTPNPPMYCPVCGAEIQ